MEESEEPKINGIILEIDLKEFEEEIQYDIGTIIGGLYPGAKISTMVGKKEGCKCYLVEGTPEVIDLEEIKRCHPIYKQKRLEKQAEVCVSCGVCKINGEYFIIDGNKRIPIFE
jgi:hypothetical protein